MHNNGKKVNELSQTTGLSKSTVSKAINHCPGVSLCARKTVLDGFSPEYGEKFTDCYVMLPDIPSKFWGEYLKMLTLPKSFDCKYNVYTHLHDNYSVNSYFSEAQSLNSRLVIAVADGNCLGDEANAYCGNHPVFFASEYADAINSFYFGCDAAQDGRILGEHFESRKGLPIIIRSAQKNANSEKCIDGFMSQTGLKDCESVVFENSYSSVLAAKLAEKLSKYSGSEKISLICPYGRSQETGLAVLKAGLEGKTELFCHNFDGTGDNPWLSGRVSFAVSVNQDNKKICDAVKRAAITYLDECIFPDNKFNTFQSETVFCPTK